jgi:hypothetical protein
MAESAIDYSYRYERESSLEVSGRSASLKLATSGGPAANPRLYTGRVVLPVLFADALLAVGAVARSRFHVPPAMLQHILLLADPVATATSDRLRFEAFSSCCSAYARLDMLPGSVDGELLGAGTTNVDLGADVRAALAGVHEGVTMHLEVGLDALSVEVDGVPHVERKVALPPRWIRGFLEVQAIQSAVQPRFQVDGAALRRFLRALPRGVTRPIHVRAQGRDLVIGHRETADSMQVGSPERLRLLERLALGATALRVFSASDGSTAWCVDLPDARFTLALSAEAWRGFSGEGRALDALAAAPDEALVTRLRGELAWQSRLVPAVLAESLGRDVAAIEAGLAVLASSGLVGFDVVEGAYFHRVLPFAADRVERSEPRLRRARQLVADEAVTLEPAVGPEIVAWVRGHNAEYRVRLGASGSACTCPWWGKHPGDRGPCAHILAAQMVRDVQAQGGHDA